MLKLQIPRYVQGEFGKQTTVEKNEGAAVFEWEKIQGGIQQHEMYILDTVDSQEKTDTRETDRFLLSHGKLSFFQVGGKGWTFSRPALSVCTSYGMTAKTWY